MIVAVVLAAGKSERMGRPKMALPWGDTTVLGKVVATLVHAGLDQVQVVTGGGRVEAERAISHLPKDWPLHLVFNPDYAAGEMLSSLQAGIASIDERSEAALIVLGDQPQMEASVVRAILGAYHEAGARLVIPSYTMRRGHPMLVDRSLWAELLSLRPPQMLRDLIQAHAADILYVTVDTPSILQDLDTPSDYQQLKP